MEISRSSEPKSRWKTGEFLIYYVIISIALFQMIATTVHISSKDNINYDKYQFRLSPGWIFSHQVDNSDAQYGYFRNNLKFLLPLFLLYTLLSKMTAKRHKLSFSFVLSLIFIVVMHGVGALKIFAIISLVYVIPKSLGDNWIVGPLVWIVGIALLFLNDHFHGYPIKGTFEGMDARWYIHFNFILLRMISYTMDYYWRLNSASSYDSSQHKKKCQDCSEGRHCARARIDDPLPKEEYNFFNYITFVLYVPLYLAGPIITFNDFISQMRTPSSSISNRSTIIYGLRWLFALFLMEVMLHSFYVTAISKSHAWEGFTPFEIAMVGYFNLKFIWLKLLIIWRFMRLWAMADDIDVVENMHRCMSNNYSALGFWRSWHRSYNRWLIRYAYIPLGGRKNYSLNILLVFTFVAIWHDISLTLLYWGWLISLFILPEIVCNKLFNREPWNEHYMFRHLCAFGAVLNIIMMMTANLVGFCVGVDGVKEMVSKMFNREGFAFLGCLFVTIFSAVQIMFEIRESEKRKARKANEGRVLRY